MDDLEDFLSANKTLLDNVRSGLQNINYEEQQLILLRNQLQKIKKIREEQMKKDQLIVSMKEQIAILENEKNISTRQNSEIQNIMSERIMTLERYTLEKESIERVYTEKIILFDDIQRERDQIKEQLMLERNKNKELTMELLRKQDDYENLYKKSFSEQEIHMHIQSVFQTLREELLYKEKEIDELKKNTFVIKEENSSKFELLSHQYDSLKQSYQQSQQEIQILSSLNIQYKSQIEDYLTRYNDSETSLISLKNSLTQMKVSIQQEKEFYEQEKQVNNESNEAIHQENLFFMNYLRKFHKTMVKVLTAISDSDSSSFVQIKYNELTQEIKQWKSILVNEIQTLSNSSGLKDGTYQLNTIHLDLFDNFIQQSIHLLSVVVEQKHQDILVKQSHKDELQSLKQNLDITQQQYQETSKQSHELSFIDIIVEKVNDTLYACFQLLVKEIKQGSEFKEIENAFDIIRSNYVSFLSTLSSSNSKISPNIVSIPVSSASNAFIANLTLLELSPNRSNQCSKLLKTILEIIHRIEELKKHEYNEEMLSNELTDLQTKYLTDITNYQQHHEETYQTINENAIQHEKILDEVKLDYEKYITEQQKASSSKLEELLQMNHNLIHLILKFIVLFYYFIYTIDEQNQKYDLLKESYHVYYKLSRGYRILLRDVKALSQLCEQQQLDSSIYPFLTPISNTRKSFRSVVYTIIAFNRFNYMLSWLRKTRKQHIIPNSLRNKIQTLLHHASPSSQVKEQQISYSNSRHNEDLNNSFASSNNCDVNHSTVVYLDLLEMINQLKLPPVFDIHLSNTSAIQEMINKLINSRSYSSQDGINFDHFFLKGKDSTVDFPWVLSRAHVNNIFKKELFAQRELNIIQTFLLNNSTEQHEFKESLQFQDETIETLRNRVHGLEQQLLEMSRDKKDLEVQFQSANQRLWIAEKQRENREIRDKLSQSAERERESNVREYRNSRQSSPDTLQPKQTLTSTSEFNLKRSSRSPEYGRSVWRDESNPSAGLNSNYSTKNSDSDYDPLRINPIHAPSEQKNRYVYGSQPINDMSNIEPSFTSNYTNQFFSSGINSNTSFTSSFDSNNLKFSDSQSEIPLSNQTQNSFQDRIAHFPRASESITSRLLKIQEREKDSSPKAFTHYPASTIYVSPISNTNKTLDTSDEVQEIYSDIGKLTRQLESRLHHVSSNREQQNKYSFYSSNRK